LPTGARNALLSERYAERGIIVERREQYGERRAQRGAFTTE